MTLPLTLASHAAHILVSNSTIFLFWPLARTVVGEGAAVFVSTNAMLTANRATFVKNHAVADGQSGTISIQVGRRVTAEVSVRRCR